MRDIIFLAGKVYNGAFSRQISTWARHFSPQNLEVKNVEAQDIGGSFLLKLNVG